MFESLPQVTASTIPKGPIVYAVTIGDKLIAIGSASDRSRLQKLCRGYATGKHVKQFAVALYAKATGLEPKIYAKAFDTKPAARAYEKELHKKHGTGVTTQEVYDLAEQMGLVSRYGDLAIRMVSGDGDVYGEMVKHCDINEFLGGYHRAARQTPRRS